MNRDSVTPLRIAVAGASGRMGHMLVEAVLEGPDTQLVGALDLASSPAIGRDAGEFLGRATGVAVTSDATLALERAQVIIDFTRPAASICVGAAMSFIRREIDWRTSIAG